MCARRPAFQRRFVSLRTITQHSRQASLKPSRSRSADGVLRNAAFRCRSALNGFIGGGASRQVELLERTCNFTLFFACTRGTRAFYLSSEGDDYLRSSAHISTLTHVYAACKVRHPLGFPLRRLGNSKCFGFVTLAPSPKIAHFSCIDMPGFKAPSEGQDVAFEVATGNGGKNQATNIQAA